MKKVFAILSAGLILASCSQEIPEPIIIGGDQEISLKFDCAISNAAGASMYLDTAAMSLHTFGDSNWNVISYNLYPLGIQEFYISTSNSSGGDFEFTGAMGAYIVEIYGSLSTDTLWAECMYYTQEDTIYQGTTYIHSL